MKYLLEWCEQCELVVIKCDDCGNATCNGGGCAKCREVFGMFRKWAHSLTRQDVEDVEAVYFHPIKALKID